MEPTMLRNMRMKQLAVTNGMLLTGFILFFIVTSVFTITFEHFFFVMGVLMLFQGAFGLIRGNSTKSIIPIIEKVAIYEKQKMGTEWSKQRKISFIWILVLSGFLFLQSYLNRNLPDHIFELEFKFMFIMAFFLLVMGNITMIIHFRKVDRSTSELEMKGYTWKSNLIAIATGTIFAMMVIIITFIILSRA